MTLLPLKMNWNPVQYKSLLNTEPIKDDHFRETVGGRKYTDPIVIRAQIYYNKFNEKSPTWTGNSEKTDGRITIKQSDLWDRGLEIKRGDLIVGIWQANGTWQTVDFEIKHVLPRGHLPASLILLVYFVERVEKLGSI